MKDSATTPDPASTSSTPSQPGVFAEKQHPAVNQQQQDDEIDSVRLSAESWVPFDPDVCLAVYPNWPPIGGDQRRRVRIQADHIRDHRNLSRMMKMGITTPKPQSKHST